MSIFLKNSLINPLSIYYTLLVNLYFFWYTLIKVIMNILLSGVICIKLDKIKRSKTIIFLVSMLVVFTLLIVILLFVSKNNSSPPNNDLQGDDPTLQHHYEDDGTKIIKNVVIDDFDEWGMGILENDKYYQIQYGVHIKDESFVGEKLGQTSSENQLTNIEGQTYQYSKSASYMLDDNTSYYEFNGSEDVILADTGDVDTTINGKWVMAPDLLSKTSFWDFIEAPENLVLTYYPSIDNLDYKYVLDDPITYLTSCKRVSSPMANMVETGYLTVDDGSGLLYGTMIYYDYDSGESYLNPPSFPNLYFKANEQLGQYLISYLSSINQ